MRQLGLQWLSCCICVWGLSFPQRKGFSPVQENLKEWCIVFRVRFGDQNLWVLIERLHMAREGRFHSPQDTYTVLQGL